MNRKSEQKRSKQGYWRLVWRQFRRSKVALVSLCILIVLLLTALAAPFLAHDRPIYMVKEGKTYWFANVIDYPELRNIPFKRWQPKEGEAVLRPPIPYSPDSQDLRIRLEPPSRQHWLGTDDGGRDLLSRLIWGTRISMSVGFVAVGIAVVIGVILGSLAGYYGGITDIAIQRLIEVMLMFPVFILILAMRAFLPPSIYTTMVIIGITGWTGVARLVRAEFLKLRESDFATAARATGLRDTRVIFRHLLPNALSPVLVSVTFGVAGAILTESGLSFLGFGVPPPAPSWGEALAQSQTYILSKDAAWWLVTFPGLAIFVTVAAFNLVGEGLRDAMDPRLRQ